jgi:hypothetical protein
LYIPVSPIFDLGTDRLPFVAWLANQTFFIPGSKVGFADSAIDFLQAHSG